ncbi:MAG: hypothetical protein ACKVOE_08635 [Rickettsiales bacterium]
MNNIASLDHNAQLPLTVSVLDDADVDGNRRLRIEINTRMMKSPSSNLLDAQGHFRQGLKVVADGTPVTTHVIDDRLHHQFLLDVVVPNSASTLSLQMYNQPVSTLVQHAGTWQPEPTTTNERMTGTELRILSTSEVCPPNVPANRELFKGFDPAKHAPITDLHTHSSAQLSDAKLIELALKHNLDYPVELLERLGITFTEKEREKIKEKGGFGLNFDPMRHEGLVCEVQNEKCDVIPLKALTEKHLARLQYQLNIPQDVTMVFSEFDREFYRFVNPIVKNPAVTHDMLMEIGRSYAEQGVRYAELSTASMLNLDPQGEPTWFKEMIAATAEVEKEYGVQLRYLVGIPRTFTPDRIMTELEKIKYAARHPLIAGVDMLGYESNPTSHFTSPLAHIAQWAKKPESELQGNGWNFLRDFTIRIHAGETNKNTGNVAAAVGIAEKYGVKVRVAHALNEIKNDDLNEKIRRLSSTIPPQLSMEFCPDSNIGYNNVQSLLEVPFKRWLQCCKSWFLGTDGGGAIQTSPIQLALSALSGGVTLKQLEGLRTREEAFIAERQQAFDEKTKAFHSLYETKKEGPAQAPDDAFLAGLKDHLEVVKKSSKLDPFQPELPPEFIGKTPILIAGAATDSWGDLDEGARKEVAACLRMLVASVDPKKAYFVVGRSKREGVVAALDEAVLEYNRDPAHKEKLLVLALSTANATEHAESIHTIIPQPGGKDQVAENTIKFMSQSELHSKKKGLCVFFGGKTTTSDMIKQCADSRDISYLLMDSAAGASKSWAPKTMDKRKFSNWQSFIPRVAETFPVRDGMDKQEIFRDEINPFDHQQLRGIEETTRGDRSFRDLVAGNVRDRPVVTVPSA